jgi:hypothetical protein
MKVIPTGLCVVIKQFPAHRETVEELLQHSEAFRSLCEDYRDCIQAREFWRGPRTEKSTSLCHEYTALCENLSEEVAQWIEEYEGAS